MILASLGTIGVLLFQWLPFLPQPPHVPVPREHTVCSAPQKDSTACFSKVKTHADGTVKPDATTKVLPGGLSPADLQKAYSVTGGTAGRIAVVTAYNHPYAKQDLDKYSSTFGLPVLPSCTTAAQTGCFEKMNQRGSKTSFPRNSRDWSFEASLDIEVAHAVCPSCRLSLIEADNSYISSLTTAVDRAVTSGAKVVSMSWGGDEFSLQTAFDSHFTNPNVNFVAASGDAGYGASWPAASGHVIAAGGTSLTVNPAGRVSETAWSGSGSGCSLYESKPSWQHDTGCANRTIADVSAVADPQTGAAIYSSYTPYGSGWFIVGGTSLSTPVISAMLATAGAGSQSAVMSQLYGAIGSPALYDVTAGSNGSCALAYLCNAGIGYDGPSGVGAPNALSAF